MDLHEEKGWIYTAEKLACRAHFFVALKTKKIGHWYPLVVTECNNNNERVSYTTTTDFSYNFAFVHRRLAYTCSILTKWRYDYLF